MATLAELKPGDKATVSQIDGDDSQVQRLLEMGLLEGSRVEFLRRAPLGDPLEIRVEGRFSLSLRMDIARLVQVDPNA